MTTALKRRLDKLERDVFYRIAVRSFMKECLSVLSQVSPEAAERLTEQLSEEQQCLRDPSLFRRAFVSEMAGLKEKAREKVKGDLRRLMHRYEGR
jgi:hypothetical protein